MRLAAMQEDYEAFKEARIAYTRSGKGYENFKASLRSIDPIANRLKDEDEIRFEREFLTGPQRQKLRVARDSAGRTAVPM